MFEYLKGLLTHVSFSTVTLDIQGLGYKIYIPLNNYSKLPQLGSITTLYIATVIREDSHRLYGFLHLHERNLFEHLIEISGIGPKTALALVGHMELADLHQAIAHNNINTICKIPGIGKKTAERLIIEMRDKIGKISDSTPAHRPTESGVIADAISALINLGYNSSQAQKATKAAATTFPKEPDLPTLITSALRHL